MNKQSILLCVCLFLHGIYQGHSWAIQAQELTPASQATKPLRFDIVVVKQAYGEGWFSKFDEAGYTGTSVPMWYLIKEAFWPIPAPEIIGEPSWARENRYDIRAKIAPEDFHSYQELNHQERAQVLQRALEDRFNLKFHHKATVHSVYNMILIGSAAKADQSKSTAGYSGIGHKFVSVRADGAYVLRTSPDKLSSVADSLSYGDDANGKPVLDKTGVDNYYDLTLTWCPVNLSADRSMGCDAPSIREALKKDLGLMLKPSKELVTSIVIDRLEKPSPN